MSRAKRSLLFIGILAVLGYAAAVAYFPSSCATTCGPNDFIQDLPSTFDDAPNRPFFWTVVALRQIRENFDELSPPGAGRISAIVGTCLYEAVAMTDPGLTSTLAPEFSFSIDNTEEMLTAAIDGAGFWAVRAIFGQRGSFSEVAELYAQVGELPLAEIVAGVESLAAGNLTDALLGNPERSDNITAAIFGAYACRLAVEDFTADGFEPDGTLGGRPDPTNYVPVNQPQRLAGITDCDNEITDIGAWQQLCIPNSFADFGTPNCVPQSFLAPFAGRYTTFALRAGDETNGDVLVGPPPAVGSPQFEEEWREVLDLSANLDDVTKIIAEYWADGPDTTAPPGHWFKIAADAALMEGLSQTDTARLLFLIGHALNDAGVASWRTKFTYNYARPLTMIQCGAYRGLTMDAWRGPYMGVGPTNISEWIPYQAANFVTPPFAAYTSGHSTFSEAAAVALGLFFQDDTYRGPACFRLPEGRSLFEPQSDALPGFSDIPNTGPRTIGYVPREDVVLCWDTYSEASDQSGVSRFLGGIHVRADDVSGQSLGRDVARDVYNRVRTLF